jgi:hypothetical protein
MKSWRWAKMLECSKSADLECRKRLSLSLDNRSFIRKYEEIDSKVRTVVVLLYILAESTGLGKREIGGLLRL